MLLIGRCSVQTGITDTYMYKAGGVACSYNIGRYPVVLSLACGAQYSPIAEIVQKTCCEAASLGYSGFTYWHVA